MNDGCYLSLLSVALSNTLTKSSVGSLFQYISVSHFITDRTCGKNSSITWGNGQGKIFSGLPLAHWLVDAPTWLSYTSQANLSTPVPTSEINPNMLMWWRQVSSLQVILGCITSTRKKLTMAEVKFIRVLM